MEGGFLKWPTAEFWMLPCRVGEDERGVGGRGGTMGRTVQTLEADGAGGTVGTDRTGGTDGTDGRKSGTAKKIKRKARGGGTARKSGAERLRRAADNEVGRKSDELAEALMNSALKGDVASTKVLVALADGMKPDTVKRRGPSLAQQLGMEPEWDGKKEDGEDGG